MKNLVPVSERIYVESCWGLKVILLVFFFFHVASNALQCCRYFDALSKGETPPVKDRLEFQLGQPLEKPLTQGLLAVLHKQVFPICPIFFLICISKVLTKINKQNLKNPSLKAPCKRIQHNVGQQLPNIFGSYMLHLFTHPVAFCCVLLGVVAQSFKVVKHWANNVGSCCVHVHVSLRCDKHPCYVVF